MFDESVARALIMSFCAGMSTLLGAGAIFFTDRQNEKMLSFSLGLAGGVMISVSLADLLPEAQRALSLPLGSEIGVILNVFFSFFGVVLAALLDKFLPDKKYINVRGRKKGLFRIGLVLALVVALHNFPEGIATFMAGYENMELGISVAFAIALHNIPEGICVAMPIYFATKNRFRALKYALFSGMTEPLGAISTFFLLRPFINEFTMGITFALLSGLMLYTALEKLIPASKEYGHFKIMFLAVFAGICVMPLTHIIG